MVHETVGGAGSGSLDVQHVLWRIRSDLRVLQTHHAMLSSEEEADYTHDLHAWVGGGYASGIEFAFVDDAMGSRRYAVFYDLSIADPVGDEDAGGLRYLALGGTSFRLVVHTNRSYSALDETSRSSFLATLRVRWPVALPFPAAHGRWQRDRCYASNAVRAIRSIYVAI